MKINKSKLNFGEKNFNLQEIAEVMGLSRERVRKIEAKALLNARKQLVSLNFKMVNFVND